MSSRKGREGGKGGGGAEIDVRDKCRQVLMCPAYVHSLMVLMITERDYVQYVCISADGNISVVTE